MDIGSAIKSLRKEKGYSQKQLAEKCDLSVNALSQIEINSAFPQKTTIKKICEVLEIPTSYLLFFSITDEDIPEHNKKIFNNLKATLEGLLLDDIKPINNDTNKALN